MYSPLSVFKKSEEHMPPKAALFSALVSIGNYLRLLNVVKGFEAQDQIP